MRKYNKKGFTLIEMLVVIAIIAVLIAVVIPTVSSSTSKAQAAADAANLRTVLGVANSFLLANNTEASASLANVQPFECKTFKGAQAYIAYQNPGFIIPFFVHEGNYYSLTYFSEVAETGSSSQPTTKPDGFEWYLVGGEN